MSHVCDSPARTIALRGSELEELRLITEPFPRAAQTPRCSRHDRAIGANRLRCWRRQTIDKLIGLRLRGLVAALLEHLRDPNVQSLSFEERLGLLVDAEQQSRDNSKRDRLLKKAKLKDSTASAEAIDYQAARGLDRAMMASILQCGWADQGQHVTITGPTGVGKTWLACALGTQAVRKGWSVLYRRTPRLLEELEIAHADGSLPKLRTQLAKVKVLILDDRGVSPMGNRGRQDLLEIVDDRYPAGSLIITSQLPVGKWHEYLGEPTIADAILDRVLNGAHRIALEGEWIRNGNN